MTFLSVGPSASCPLPPPTQVTISFNYSHKTMFSESPILSWGCNINITAYPTIVLLTKTEDDNHCHSNLLLLAWKPRNKASLWLEFGCLLFKARKAFQAKHSAWKENCSQMRSELWTPQLSVQLLRQDRIKWGGLKGLRAQKCQQCHQEEGAYLNIHHPFAQATILNHGKLPFL